VLEEEQLILQKEGAADVRKTTVNHRRGSGRALRMDREVLRENKAKGKNQGTQD